MILFGFFYAFLVFIPTLPPLRLRPPTVLEPNRHAHLIRRRRRHKSPTHAFPPVALHELPQLLDLVPDQIAGRPRIHCGVMSRTIALLDVLAQVVAYEHAQWHLTGQSLTVRPDGEG